MFESSHKPVDSGSTLTVFLIAIAFIFIPSGVVFFRPVGGMLLALAAMCSMLCLVVAWINWKRSFKRPLADIAIINEGAK